MKRVLIGSLLVGVILSICPSNRSSIACFITGVFSTLLLLQVGPRSIVEKVGLLLTVAAIAWLAGPRAALHQSLFWHFFGWTIAASSLAMYLHPRAR